MQTVKPSFNPMSCSSIDVNQKPHRYNEQRSKKTELAKLTRLPAADTKPERLNERYELRGQLVVRAREEGGRPRTKV
ncbi:hypothetical protein E2C01_090200 [Portunus trituberculatus]|uniref:Uncharacterized protein n=1 Tax=Portunus trituberculatus TaxID=210409 RepID=A0A5B7JPI4_PORTR|nr:hypothetical protein [Portunus trituberculatus]